MSLLLAILATLAAGIATLAIAYAAGTRLSPVAMAFGALAILVAAGITLIAVVRHDVTTPVSRPPAHGPASREP